MAIGADGSFVKPLGEAAFREAVRSVSDNWLQAHPRKEGSDGQAGPPARD